MKKLRLNTLNIKNQSDLIESFDTLIDFPGWNSIKLDEWLDMHALSDSGNPALRRFYSQKPQHYVLEISNSNLFMGRQKKQFEALIIMIQNINRGYIERTGRPLISTLLM